MSNIQKKYYYINLKEKLILYSVLISALFLAICSKSSFLYPINDWVDSNCFLTMGKAIVNGKALYADIYEQKGPILYFIHSIAYLISRNTFFGVYILEVISFGIFLYFSIKCCELYLKDQKIYFVFIPIVALSILVSRAFSHGDSAEEFSLMFLIITLYLVLRALHNNRCVKNSEAIIIGMGAASILWIKYTMLGFYMGLIFFIVIWYVLEKNIKKLLKNALFFIIGVMAVSVPILIYFITSNSLKDMFYTYFYNNMFLYSVPMSENRIIVIINLIFEMIGNNICFSIFVIVGLVWVYLKNSKEGVAIVCSFLGLALGVYFGGRAYVYYGLVFSVYTGFGVCALLSELVENKKLRIRNRLVYRMIVTVIILCCSVMSYYLSDNTYLMHYKKEELPQYIFAQKIKNVKNASLLNYGFLDGGFYLAADVIPSNKYFCTLNIPLQQMWDEQNRDIESGKNDFVVTRDVQLEDYNIDTSHYRMIEEAAMYFEGKEYVYYLYQNVK